MKEAEIIKKLELPNFVADTKEQLKREFLKVGIELKLEESMMTKTEIVQELSQELSAILDQDPQLLAQLFYSIDLSEEKVKSAMNFDENISDNIAELILIRAAQKVYIKSII